MFKARHWKTPVGCSRHLYDARLINYRAIKTPCEGVKDLADGERLGRKFTCAPFIPHGRGLKFLLQADHATNEPFHGKPTIWTDVIIC